MARTIDSIEDAGLTRRLNTKNLAWRIRASRESAILLYHLRAVSRHGGATALASTKDFKSFQRHGIIFCPETRTVVLFPEKIGGQYYALHRRTAQPLSPSRKCGWPILPT